MTTQSEIAQTYKAKLAFEWHYTPDQFPPTTSREEIYWFIRESVAKAVLELGFDSFGDIVDSVEIFESEEKI